MRQLLMLGFYCEVYRREPVCRVYVNNVLVDEFDIPHTNTKHKQTLDADRYWSQDEFDFKLNTLFLKFIELDNTDGKYLDLKIEIQNNDNNYANGFMTKHTCIMLRQCRLAPVKFWEEFEQIRDRWKYSRHNWNRYFGGTRSIAHFYTGSRSLALQNLATDANMHFPDITQQPLSKNQLKSRFSNYQDLPTVWQDSPDQWWAGTSGHFHITLKKKLGFWRHRTDRRHGWWKLSQISNVKDLYDKYRHYEDTRNSNQ